MNDLLRISDLTVDFTLPFGALRAVDGVSFDIPRRGAVALVGESGSGKSVIAQSILGILPRAAVIAKGAILFAEDRDRPVDLTRLPQDGKVMRSIRGGRIGIIFQEPMAALSPVHRIGDQVGEALRLHRALSAAAAAELTRETLRLVGFPDVAAAMAAYPFELSGGLRQRAMIAAALACRPALLIADEPTTALDVTIQAQIIKLLKDLQSELGMALLLITHDLGVVANLAERIVVLYRGRMVESGSAEDLFGDPRHPYLKALLRAAPRQDMAPGEKLVSIRASQRAMCRHLSAAAEPRRSDNGAPLLTATGVAKGYAPRRAGGWLGRPTAPRPVLRDFDLEIRRGECVGLVGESGCGKTTASKLIMRALDADAGSILYHGDDGPIDVGALSGGALKAYRRRVQYVFQDPFSAFDPRMTVLELITEPLVIHDIGSPEQRREVARDLMRVVGLDPAMVQRFPHSFSGGQRQRIGIARALALKPDLLICDEPVSALDVSIQAQILNLLNELRVELGLTFLFISHNLAVVDYVADRIAVMCAGRIVEIAPRGALFRHPVHPYTRALIAAIPEPRLDRPLDLAHLAAGRASDPACWPAPFGGRGAATPGMIEIRPGHAVRASPALVG